mmetsp:Transcript_30084/g.61065  ORF Transcript_30084/g.61065 Transcript_30084/m.61065 type:complete len:102 (-) Transcript_30084:379-684(-)
MKCRSRKSKETLIVEKRTEDPNKPNNTIPSILILIGSIAGLSVEFLCVIFHSCLGAREKSPGTLALLPVCYHDKKKKGTAVLVESGSGATGHKVGPFTSQD